MISDSQTRYGSARRPGGARHGRVRRCRSYQASKSVGCGDEIAARPLARCRPAGFTASVVVAAIAGRDDRAKSFEQAFSMNKSSRPFAQPLRDIAGKIVGETFTRQGFASA